MRGVTSLFSGSSLPLFLVELNLYTHWGILNAGVSIEGFEHSSQFVEELASQDISENPRYLGSSVEVECKTGGVSSGARPSFAPDA